MRRFSRAAIGLASIALFAGAALADSPTHRVLVIGDSSTAGVVSGGYGLPYPTLLQSALGAGFLPINLGCSGGNSANWDPNAGGQGCFGFGGAAYPIFETLVGLNLPADVATILLGTIDSGFPGLTVEPDDYRAHMIDIIAELDARGVEHIILMSAPKRGDGEPEVDARLQAFRDLIFDPVAGLCAITAASCGPDLHEDLDRQLYFEGSDTHPNAAGHFAIATWLAASILTAIPPTACDNGQDDDGDGWTDFAEDPECRDAGDESEVSDCSDGLDQDGDGLADYPLDPGCGAGTDADELDPLLACDNGVDDDGDGNADFPADLGCLHPTDASEREASLPCDDGIDNDGDGNVDYPEDPGCSGAADGSEVVACSNGIDDDGDGQSDHPGDSGCRNAADASEELDCSDGIDNDNDGWADFPNDRSCKSASWPKETSQCSDGIDNDGDGGIDTFFTPSPLDDADCNLRPWKDTEEGKSGGCGIGGEWVLGLFALARLRRCELDSPHRREFRHLQR